MDPKYLSRHIGLLAEGGQERLQTIKIDVIGAGALGSWFIPAAQGMGCEDITIYDDDVVDETNISNQNYGIPDIGKPKVEAMRDLCFRKDPDCKYKFIQSRVTKETVLDGEIMIMAVDSIDARKLLFEKAKESATCKLFMDTRLGRTLVNFFAVNVKDSNEMEYYSDNYIFPAEEGAQLPCTEKTFMGPVLFAASLYTDVLRSYINNKLKDQPFNVTQDTAISFFERLPRKKIQELVLG